MDIKEYNKKLDEKLKCIKCGTTKNLECNEECLFKVKLINIVENTNITSLEVPFFYRSYTKPLIFFKDLIKKNKEIHPNNQ